MASLLGVSRAAPDSGVDSRVGLGVAVDVAVAVCVGVMVHDGRGVGFHTAPGVTVTPFMRGASMIGKAPV